MIVLKCNPLKWRTKGSIISIVPPTLAYCNLLTRAFQLAYRLCCSPQKNQIFTEAFQVDWWWTLYTQLVKLIMSVSRWFVIVRTKLPKYFSNVLAAYSYEELSSRYLCSYNIVRGARVSITLPIISVPMGFYRSVREISIYPHPYTNIKRKYDVLLKPIDIRNCDDEYIPFQINISLLFAVQFWRALFRR